MKINGTHYRSLWWDEDQSVLMIIDQRWLPHEFRIQPVATLEEFATAIVEMRVRGAPLIGATAAYGMALAAELDPSDSALQAAWEQLNATRPTAINLRWALNRCLETLRPLPEEDRAKAALKLAHAIADEDVEINRRIGAYGLTLIRDIAAKKPAGEPVRLLTHCNAGWIATVDWGTATSPMYQAHDAGIPIHVWVDETRPRNQGALTAWELGSHGISHSYITDNAGGHLMQHGQVDLVITGTDRTTRQGDVCNKIGTYLKALAARDNGVPFYVALPSPTIDWTVTDGVAEIPIEDRDSREVSHVQGVLEGGDIGLAQVTPEGTACGNPAFDVTPNRLVTGLITERGICDASAEGLAALFPDLIRKAG
ncbi:S-methyl-5-thioribose-1-phosphate isomerase [Phaeobacter piscinae]|uniref:Methylthioribose-1-phosphate isomerase n=1 Tax=Phaeobacter piscinae TaxID=1580596 RepID=A0ABN5DJF5_9RHOB|nr:S-methyl-5-thioribose-1-phosphate isomerase [Phaeobacter piscinae]ATG35694.1 methylthioribose-1-phosphate isomerase MtnA [Phaeobacter piscinae]ATG39629.1 methylthioribose-1-phosphate isomerase MtnA [Phaeobacter piscinae]AUQ86215.1 methylthioribose-1-phosphate isomerase MtnA [Phaeobacter piscinae]AUR24098.1 methylthioribose-1-phosphate isomerase MtnA [Phaeobacter piscinae]UTS80608.1 Methylthioribose-1-phosphate isomerase [Phaeobacter piscinae]